jgi:hypothetical protein
MTVRFPDKVVWNAANWVERQFFADAAVHLSEVPHLAQAIEDGLESGILRLALDGADPVLLAEAELLVERVLAANLTTRGESFHDPSGFPVYLDKLRELRGLVRAATAGPAIAGAASLDDTYLFDYGSENAPDSPTGLERLMVQPDGRFRFHNRQRGELLVERTGSIERAALEEIAGYLAASGFPQVPDHARPPGADYLTISSGDRHAFMRVKDARTFPGYDGLLRRILPWMKYLVALEGEAPAALRIDPVTGGVKA